MNLSTTIAVIVVAILLFAASMKLRDMSQSEKYEKDERTFFRWISKIIWLILFLGAIIGADMFGYIDIPNPFDGPKINETMMTPQPDYSAPVEAPELEGKTNKPDMDAVKNEHQEQLDNFHPE